MLNKGSITLVALVIGAVVGAGIAYYNANLAMDSVGAPSQTTTRDLQPFADSTYEIGTTTTAYLRGTFDELCLTADACNTSWPSGSGGLHVDGGGFLYPQAGDYHSAPYYVGTSTSATSTFVHASSSYLSVGGDYLTDITGTNLSVSSGVLSVDNPVVANLTGNADTVTTNANLTGEVTSVGNAATIADNVIQEVNLEMNAPTNEYIMVASSTATGGFIWAATSTANLGFIQNSDLHDAVTVSGTPDYITLSGQDIVRAKLDLPDDINTFTEAQLETAVSDDNPLFDGDIGGSVQAWDAELDTIAALTETNGNVMFVSGGAWTSDATPAINGADFTGIVTGGITDDTILEADLDLVDTPTDEECLTYESGAGGDFEWQSCGAGSSEWTDNGTDIEPTEPTDQVSIGTTTANALATLTVSATSTDTTKLQSWLNSNNEEVMWIGPGGDLNLASTTAATSTIKDNSGNDAIRLMESDGEGVELDFGTAGDVILRGLSSVAEFVSDLNFTLTGILDFGGATSVEIPNGANPTVNATGEIAVDTTNAQAIVYDGAEVDVLLSSVPRALGAIGSTSPDRDLNSFSSATTTWSLGSLFENSTIPQVLVYTDTGTCNFVIGDGAATTTVFVASTTKQVITYSSNNAFVTTDNPVIEIGSCASSPNWIDVTVDWKETRQ